MKTSHVRNRPFDFKLIDLVQPHPVLYERQRGLTNFQIMKKKNELWVNIGNQLGCKANFCLMRWNNLRGQYQKEYRRCLEKRDTTSNWPYFKRLSFLEKTLQCNRKSTKQGLKNASLAQKSSVDEMFEVCSDYSNNEDYKANLKEFKTLDELLMMESQIIVEIPTENIPTTTTTTTLVDKPLNNLKKIEELLKSFSLEKRKELENRIMAYLCNLQLRCLNQQTIEDLKI